jgi:hypothetical protein
MGAGRPGDLEMTDILCTIADSKYGKYAKQLIKSARDTGFDGEVKIIEPHRRRFNPPTRFEDTRWMQFSLDNYFRYNDRVLYMDADCVFHESFPWDSIFDNEFACSVMPDWANEIMVINHLSGVQVKHKYIGTPLVFRKSPGTDKFFRLCRALIYASAYYGRGSMVPFNVACQFLNKPNNIIAEGKIRYSMDIDNDVPEQNMWITHFAGGRGKEQWNKFYE